MPDAAASAAFLEAVRPLAERARRRLEEAAREIAGSGSVPFDPAEAVSLLWPAVEGRLLTMLARTLVLELHVARAEGRLEGATPEERFQSFARALRDPGFILGLWWEYPVLARQIAAALDRWVATGREFLSHLAADGPALREALSPERDPGRLVALAGSGDARRGGRAVLIATFASGLKVVYKPRPLAADVHFQELLAWLNERSGQPPFRTLRVLDRGDHGWVEFVVAGPCASEEEVRRFHLRLGGLLAVFYALEATDFHFENLIAAGEQPVAVDLECLFHPRTRGAAIEQPDMALVSAFLSRSVVRVGLLPFRIEAGEDAHSIDISGLAAVEGEMTPNPILQWEKPGTDEMVAVRRRLPLPGGSNRPRLIDREVDTLDYAASFAEGFTAMYRTLVRHREELSARLGRFADDPVRAVLRATRGYHLLWFESFHPDMLRDALDRDLFLDRLWLGVDEHPHLIPPLPFERRDLEAGDIPAFGSRPGSADLGSASGERVPDYFEEPALAAVRRKLAGLGEDDLRRQTWLVRSSLATLVLRREVVPWPRYTPEEPPGEVSLAELRPRLLAQGRAVGERLAGLALRGDAGATWMGVEFHHQRWSLVPLGEDLYMGTPGLALFWLTWARPWAKTGSLSWPGTPCVRCGAGWHPRRRPSPIPAPSRAGAASSTSSPGSRPCGTTGTSWPRRRRWSNAYRPSSRRTRTSTSSRVRRAPSAAFSPSGGPADRGGLWKSRRSAASTSWPAPSRWAAASAGGRGSRPSSRRPASRTARRGSAGRSGSSEAPPATRGSATPLSAPCSTSTAATTRHGTTGWTPGTPKGAGS